MAVQPIPEGFHSATPYLVVSDAAAAIEFYKKVFHAVELTTRLKVPSGKIAHAEIQIGTSPIMLADEFPEWGNQSPKTLGGSAGAVHLYLKDVDEVAERAVAAGAKIIHPIADQFYGDRGCRLEDPFGHMWIIATHKEDVGPEEMQRRFDEFIKTQGK